MTAKLNFGKKVWDTLSKINVNDHTSKKGKMTYLSWSWAWATMMEHYPETTYHFDDTFIMANDTSEVWVSMTVKDGEHEITHKMWLPVMDNRNNSVVNATTRDISDTRMRCLTKAMAMFGLGHYIYAGEGLPRDDDDLTKEFAEAKTMDEVLAIWGSLSPVQHKQYENKKNEAKARLSA